jgi:hypothetical protein
MDFFLFEGRASDINAYYGNLISVILKITSSNLFDADEPWASSVCRPL